MRYKIGDKVRIRSDLEMRGDYNGLDVFFGMLNFKGKLVTISDAYDDGIGISYKIREDTRDYQWDESMFAPLTNGDRVRCMTDEELAKMLTSNVCPIGCNGETNRDICESESCFQCVFDWLQCSNNGYKILGFDISNGEKDGV